MWEPWANAFCTIAMFFTVGALTGIVIAFGFEVLVWCRRTLFRQQD